MKRKYKGKEYLVRDYACKKRDCFVPFSGNGIYICRRYELGECPEHVSDVVKIKAKSYQLKKEKEIASLRDQISDMVKAKNETIYSLIYALKELCDIQYYKDNVGDDASYMERQSEALKQATELLNNLSGYGEYWSGGFAENN